MSKTKHEVVGIYLDRSDLLLEIIYICFARGITYVPLDLSWPFKRISTIIDDVSMAYIITSSKYSNRFLNVKQIIIDEIGDVKKLYGLQNDNKYAYILYTSGTTGVPKGVIILRDALYNFIDGVSAVIPFRKESTIACFTPVTFDIFFLESVMAKHKGLRVVMANDIEQNNPKEMVRLLMEHKIEMLQITPSRMQLLMNCDPDLNSLRYCKIIMLGGEPLPFNMLSILQRKTTARIYNMYGPTETTIWSTIGELTEENRIHVGTPINNTQIFILNESMEPVQQGAVGEICISGKGLAEGYIHNADLTSEKFVWLPQRQDVRVYRTGDYGRWLDDGKLECLGRMDNQVKMNGHRIELEEIEFYLCRYPGILQSMAVVKQLSDHSSVLIAYYTATNAINSIDVMNYLSKEIPSYMIPSILYRVNEFSYTANGKLDRRNAPLSLYNDTAPKIDCLDEKLSDRQSAIYEVIRSALPESLANTVEISDNLRNIGVNSINYICILDSLEYIFEIEFPTEMMLFSAFQSLRDMIEYVDSLIESKNQSL